MRVLIVSENVSMKMGGEASLPFYYFKLLRNRGIDVWMLCHARVREELRQAFPDDKDFNKIKFIEDTWLQVKTWQAGSQFPPRIQELIFDQLIHIITQQQARLIAKTMIKELAIDLVFEPAPLMPKGLSFMYDMGIPIAIGPLCGGLEFPPAFRYMDSPSTIIAVRLGRIFSFIMQRLVPGKLRADTLIVANQRTADALPKGYKGKVYEVVESGVDLSIWQPEQRQRHQAESDSNQSVRFVYSGRFVDWKGTQFLVEAFQKIAVKTNAILELIGDGQLRNQIETSVVEKHLQERIKFHGWLTREESANIIRNCDVFVMPSLRECGGTALLEAMALGLPVIATNWAGPASYVDSTCGILVEPTSPEEFINGLAEAMLRLSKSPQLRHQMGEAGISRMKTNYYDWDSKAERIIEIFQETLQRTK